MIVREADFSKDALAIVNGAKDFMKFTGISIMPAEEDVSEVVSRVLTHDGVTVLVAEHNGKIYGGIGIFFTPYTWNPSVMIAEELFWWASDDAPKLAGLKLFKEGMKLIDKMGAKPMFKALSNSPKGVHLYYQKYKMRPIETMYARFE